MNYSIDTSALLDGWVRWYPPDVFPSVWKRFDQLIEAGSAVASDEVLRELSRRDDEIHVWCKQRPKLFVPLDDEIQYATLEVLNQFPRMVDQRPGKNFGDPFVVALAKARKLTVVTGEIGGTQDRPKIPFVCQHFGIPCINLVQLLREIEAQF